jgi:outer membrane autotransporter protein
VEEQEVCPAEKRRAFWVAPFGGLTHQHKQSGQVGFNTEAGGVTAGMDYSPWRHWTFGGAVGYSYVHLKWEEGRGNSNMQNAYGALYAGTSCKHAYLFGTAMGSYNHYDASRHMVIGEGLVMAIDRHAKSAHHGWQGSGHLQGGLLFGKKVQFAPFIEADYIYVHEHSFNENGAKSLDLHVKEKNSDLLQGEAGFEISKCFSTSKNKVSPSIGFSVIREWRFMGKHEKSSFAGSSCVMHTTGMNPDRTLYSPAAGVTLLLPDENRTLSFEYKGKFGEHFQDNHLLAQFLYRF